MKTITIVKNKADGTVRMVYSDEAAPFLETLGTSQITRATDVEPTNTHDWEAVLRDDSQTVLAVERKRSDAISKEVEYLNTHIITDAERFDAILNGKAKEKELSD